MSLCSCRKSFFYILRKTFSAILLTSFLPGLFVNCSGKKDDAQSSESPAAFSPAYYIFTNDGQLNRISNLESLAQYRGGKKPWTEAAAASGICLSLKPALFLVNKVGVINFFADGSPEIHSASVFRSLSVSDFFNTTDGLLFRSYKNSLFSDTENVPTPAPFLYKYNPITERCSPYKTAADLNLAETAQNTLLKKYGETWLASFKTESGNQVNFDYVSFSALTSIPETVGAVSKALFQDTAVPAKLVAGKSYTSKASTLLAALAKKIFTQGTVTGKLLIELADTKGECTQIFECSETSADADAVKTEPIYYAAYDEDAARLQLLSPTGLLQEMDGQNTVLTYQLPALPDGFVYTYFSVEEFTDGDRETAQSYIIAFFEKQDFFQIGCAGFLVLPAKGLEPLRSCPQ